MEKSQENIHWANIPGVPEIFEVSNTGLVKNRVTGTVFKQRVTRGYYYVRLAIMVNGEKIFSKNLSVHRLVAKAFVYGESSSKKEVNHINGDRLNNHWSNLEWVTPSENVQHAIKLGLVDHSKFNYHTTISPTEIDIIFSLREDGMKHKAIARLLHIGTSTVTHILNGTRRKNY